MVDVDPVEPDGERPRQMVGWPTSDPNASTPADRAAASSSGVHRRQSCWPPGCGGRRACGGAPRGRRRCARGPRGGSRGPGGPRVRRPHAVEHEQVVITSQSDRSPPTAGPPRSPPGGPHHLQVEAQLVVRPSSVDLVERRDAEAPQPPRRQPADDDRRKANRTTASCTRTGTRSAARRTSDSMSTPRSSALANASRSSGDCAGRTRRPDGRTPAPPARAAAVVLVAHAGHARAPRRPRRGSCAASR